MKRINSTLLFLVIFFGVAFGGTAWAQKAIEFQLGHGLAVNTPADLGAKRFAELVNERSGGDIKITVFPGGALGNEQQLIEGLQIGALDMAVTVGAGFGTVLPEANALGFLYLFRDPDHMQRVMRGDIGAELAKKLYDQTSIRLIDGSWYYGTRHLTANRPVVHPDDLKGMRVRVLPVPIYEAGWRALGASPTPIAFGELFTAIETNTVDAQENPLSIIKSVGIPLVHKNLTLTGHIVANITVAMSDDAYKKLSDDQIELIRTAARDAGAYQDEIVRNADGALIDEFKAAGMKIVDPDQNEFRAKVADLPSKFEGGKLADLFDRIQAVE
ncbi:TRAP transporter substrate-binding protein [Castellaniella sp.]|uniref:TRAP transporter substrate-binding protein n=1 Tax=Castellaniella sp. TaxID=1955812 RepID=UPI003565F206